MKYSALFEDEDDIFLGSPESKFNDIMFNANRNIATNELNSMVKKLAMMEILLADKYDAEELEKKFRSMALVEAEAVEEKSKSIYVELTGNILCQSE